MATEEAKAAAKKAAQKEKEAGNDDYKKRFFESAILHYNSALELDNEDITYILNRAAVYFEMKKYDDCIKDCDKAVERGRELMSDTKMIAKALVRKGTAIVNMATCSTDLDLAITTFEQALLEHYNTETVKKLEEAKKANEKYLFNPEIAYEELHKGNVFFKARKYSDAIQHYSEALRRNPNDHKAYSRRASSYIKLESMSSGLKDAEKCIELAPHYAKGYCQKGHVQFSRKDYHTALETYQKGLKLAPFNKELVDAVKVCQEKIDHLTRGTLSKEEMREIQGKSLEDPEIQMILKDPVIRDIILNMETNPEAFKEVLTHKVVMEKVQKLVRAGILQIA